jgi:RNA polymerase sigma factor for flagellar operon FliA
VTTLAKAKYLIALGFEPSSEHPDVVDQLTAGQNPPFGHARRPSSTFIDMDVAADAIDLTTSATNTQPEKLEPSSHFVWSSSDGEWERATGGTAVDPAPSHPSEPHTLAGSVAEIENTIELDDVWTRYKDAPTQEDRDQLIVYYAPLVKYVASRIAAGLPQNVDQADLVSYGMFGLIDAITKFDPSRGFKFETYAISRIKGAVLDELRSIDWVPRSVRAKAKSVERAMTKLEAQLHRAPTDDEIAEELDLTSAQLTTIYNQISSLGLVALDEMLSFNGGDNLTLGDTLADRQDGPGGVYERVEMRQMLAEAINRMGEREKIVLTLYYYENLTLAEIGNVLGVTESRVCQIHTKAVLHLRSRLSAAEREAV